MTVSDEKHESSASLIDHDKFSTPTKDDDLDSSRLTESPPGWDKVTGQECNRIIPGTSSLQNKDSISFGQEGCIAYGSRNLVVVVEAITGQIIQTLHKHRQTVIRTSWAGSIERRLGLASADSGGHILVWDIESGECVRQLQDGVQPVTDIKWLDGRIAKTGHLLLAIHCPNHVVLWNTWTGAKLWKYSPPDQLLISLDLDPFNTNRLLLLSSTSVLMIEDFHPTKVPTREPKKFYVMNNKRGSPGRTLHKDLVTPTEDRMASDAKGTKLSKMMRQMVLGPLDARNSPSHSLETAAGTNTSAVFHRCMRDVIILSFPTEISLLDIKLCQVICCINLDRIHSPVVGTYSCGERDSIYVLHESGSVSVWRRKSILSVLATPAVSVPRSFSMSGGLGASSGGGGGTGSMSARTSVVSLDTTFETAGSDLILEIGYESRVQSEHVRMGKNSRVLGLAVHPVNQDQISFFTSDGKVYILEYDEGPEAGGGQWPGIGDSVLANQKITIKSIIGSHSANLTVIRMCPPVSSKASTSLLAYKPLLAAGAKSGNILVFNMATGHLDRELSVHTGPVKDLQWISGSPANAVISCSHNGVSGSNLVKNELIHTNVLTGKTKILRGERGEEPRITMVRVSSARQFFVIAFANGPFELWDANKLCLLRTMPKKFPHVSALTWSPTHTRTKKRNSTASSESKTPSEISHKTMPVKEHILFSDLDSQLFHFSVEGHTIRDGSKIPAETGLGHVNSLSCKSEVIVRGDTEGNINIWNVKARQSKNIHTGRGNIKSVKFSPGGGKSNLKLLVVYNDGLAIWDIKEMEVLNELKTPRSIPEVECADWISSQRIAVLCTDGSIFTMGLALVTTPSLATNIKREQNLRCPSLLEPKLFSKLAFSLAASMPDSGHEKRHHDQDDLQSTLEKGFALDKYLETSVRNLKYAHIFGLKFEQRFWNLINSQDKKALSGGYDFFCEDHVYNKRESEKSKLYLNRASADSKTRALATARLLCTGELEPAVKLLLETDPTDDLFLSDQFLACLISTTSTAVDCNQLSTTKLVATKLIAEGKLWEGVQLLCLVGKVWDACTYLRASKHWDETIWLAKLRLQHEEYLQICKKYAEFLISQGRYEECILLHASNRNWSECASVLHLGQFRSLAVRLLEHVGADNLDPVLGEAIRLEAATFLFEVGHTEAAKYYCSLIGDKGAALMSEYNVSA